MYVCTILRHTRCTCHVALVTEVRKSQKKIHLFLNFKSFWDVQRKLPVHATGTYAHTVHKSSRSRHINVYECIFNLFVVFIIYYFI